MAEQKILISININDKQATKGLGAVEAATKRLNKELSDEARELAVVNENLRIAKERNKEYAKAQIQLSSTNDGFNKSLKGTSAALKQGRAQSGLNNAILLETGRLASDAGYGFTAIANNLSQVVTLFSSFAKTNGGVIASFKQLTKSLIGSGGFLIAIQLLISFGPQIFAFFKRLLGFTTELQDTFKNASKTVKDSAGTFETYIRTLQDSTKSQEEQNDAIKGLNKSFPNYIKNLNEAKLGVDDIRKGTAEAVKITDAYRETIIKQAIARQAQIKIDEAAGKIIDLRIEEEMYALDNAEKFKTRAVKIQSKERIYLKEVEAFGEESLRAKTAKRKLDGAKKELEEDKNFNAEKIKEQEDYIAKLIKFTDIEIKERKKGPRGPRERDFKQQLLNLEKLEESYRQKSIDQTLMTEDEKINEQEKFAKKELKIRLEQFNERQALRLQEFKESDASAAEKAKAEKEYNESIVLAQQEHDEVMVQLQASFNTKREKLTRKRAERASEETQKARDTQREIEKQSLQDLRTFDEEANTIYFEANAAFLERLMDRQQGIIDNEHSTADQIASARKEQFELLAQLRQNDLDQEIASIEAKKAVNLEYAGFASSIGDTLSNLAGENEALAKAALVVEKGAAIAKVIITAQTSIAAKTASANAIPAFLPPFGTPNPAYVAGQAEAKKSNLRTKVGAALAIANILSTMIGKKGGAKDTSGGGGDGGGNVIQAPDFNVVGASQTSQLAQAVTTQQAKPVKAFVVGKDISTQQELDRNTTNTASFG